MLFKYFQHEARFPDSAEDVPLPVIEFLAIHLRGGVPTKHGKHMIIQIVEIKS
ncbi:hypothetical protein [Collibacillus ludicampi]|uniref:hypothetical protein n=1 Tax=Collibacillus ludicampi TaxID=2771369 RepID=UPI003F6F7816